MTLHCRWWTPVNQHESLCACFCSCLSDCVTHTCTSHTNTSRNCFFVSYPVRRQHILRLLLSVLGGHLKGVSLLKVLLEQRQLLWSRAGGGRRLTARGDGRRTTLTHELKLLDRRRWGKNVANYYWLHLQIIVRSWMRQKTFFDFWLKGNEQANCLLQCQLLGVA